MSVALGNPVRNDLGQGISIHPELVIRVLLLIVLVEEDNSFKPVFDEVKCE